MTLKEKLIDFLIKEKGINEVNRGFLQVTKEFDKYVLNKISFNEFNEIARHYVFKLMTETPKKLSAANYASKSRELIRYNDLYVNLIPEARKLKEYLNSLFKLAYKNIKKIR